MQVTQVLSHVDAADASTHATTAAPITLKANTFYIMLVRNTKGTTPAVVPPPAGWTIKDTVLFSTIALPTHRWTALYHLHGATDTPSSTFSFAWGSSHNGFECRVLEVGGVVTTGTNGVDAFTQGKTATLDTNAAILALTFDNPPAAACSILACLARSGVQEASTPKAGYTNLGLAQFTPPSASSQVAFLDGPDSSPEFTWTTVSRGALIAYELNAQSTIPPAQRSGWLQRVEQLLGKATLVGARLQTRDVELDDVAVPGYRKRLYVVVNDLRDLRQDLLTNADDLEAPLALLEGDAIDLAAEITAGAAATPKALAAGLMERNSLPSSAFIEGWNPEIKWRDLQTSQGASIVGSAGATTIENALAGAKDVRVRLKLGIWAPQWLKSLAGTVDTINTQDGLRDTTGDSPAGSPVWWESAYFDAFADLHSKLAAEYDADVLFTTVEFCPSSTLYSEPFQKHFSPSATTGLIGNTGLTSIQIADQNRARALAKGYTVTKDKAGWDQYWAAVAVWSETNIVTAFNPYQYIGGDGLGYQEEAFMRAQGARGRQAFGSRFILQNDSIREKMALNPPSMFDMLLPTTAGGLGKPVSMQTSTWARVSKFSPGATEQQRHDGLVVTINYCINTLQAHALELPQGHNLTNLELEDFNTRLKANV